MNIARVIDLQPVSPPSFKLHRRAASVKGWRVTAIGVGLVFLASLALALTVLVQRLESANLGVIVPGEVYRSGQLNDAQLQAAVATFHLKSVLNLRGANPGTAWYDHEMATCRGKGLVHADLRLSARHIPQPVELAQLITDFRTLPRPILVHCCDGSDRTGLAAAVYLIAVRGVSPIEAERALDWRYGHLPLYPYFEMNELLELFAGENPQHLSLLDWTERDYPAIYAAESRETAWDEFLEPIESTLHIRYWVPVIAQSPAAPLPGRP